METDVSFPAIARLAETGEGLREALGEMAKALYGNPRIYGLRDGEDVGELFARYPGRIEAILRKYRKASGYFPAYLVATVRFLALTLKRDRARAYDRQMVFDEDAMFCFEDPEEAEYAEDRPVSPLPEASGRGRYRRRSLKSRFVFLSLKCAWSVDDKALFRAAETLGVDTADLCRRVAEARTRTCVIKDRFETRKAARDASWVRLRILERRFLREEDPYARAVYQERIARERERFQKRLEETRRARIAVSNRTVAEVLGVPKGTVDAGLFHAARRIRDFQLQGEKR